MKLVNENWLLVHNPVNTNLIHAIDSVFQINQKLLIFWNKVHNEVL